MQYRDAGAGTEARRRFRCVWHEDIGRVFVADVFVQALRERRDATGGGRIRDGTRLIMKSDLGRDRTGLVDSARQITAANSN